MVDNGQQLNWSAEWEHRIGVIYTKSALYRLDREYAIRLNHKNIWMRLV